MAFAGVASQISFVVIAAIFSLIYMGKAPVFQKKILEVVHGQPGCLPVPKVGNVSLHYFAGRGRAEVIRFLMEEAEISYTESSYTRETWLVYKRKGIDDGLLTFGQVPAIVTTSGTRMVQTQAILHYLARSSGMDCDCEDYSKCEVLALGVEDARMKLTRMLYDPGFSMSDRNHYLKEVMPVWLGYFEKLAPPLAKQEKAFFASDRLTWVDFLVFDLIDANKDFGRYDFGQSSLNTEVLGQFPKLNNFYRQMAGRPRIARFLRSEGRHPYKIPNLPQDLPQTS